VEWYITREKIRPVSTADNKEVPKSYKVVIIHPLPIQTGKNEEKRSKSAPKRGEKRRKAREKELSKRTAIRYPTARRAENLEIVFQFSVFREQITRL